MSNLLLHMPPYSTVVDKGRDRALRVPHNQQQHQQKQHRTGNYTTTTALAAAVAVPALCDQLVVQSTHHAHRIVVAAGREGVAVLDAMVF